MPAYYLPIVIGIALIILIGFLGGPKIENISLEVSKRDSDLIKLSNIKDAKQLPTILILPQACAKR